MQSGEEKEKHCLLDVSGMWNATSWAKGVLIDVSNQSTMDLLFKPLNRAYCDACYLDFCVNLDSSQII